MYRRILLAYDGSSEGRKALREGALLAKQCGAAIYLLSVASASAAVKLAESAHAGASTHHNATLRAVFDEGVERLRQMGFAPVARLVEGDPAEEIRKFAREIRADLVVVGHRRKSILERWWSGPSGAFLSDQLACSLIVSRNLIPDEAFERATARAAST